MEAQTETGKYVAGMRASAGRAVPWFENCIELSTALRLYIKCRFGFHAARLAFRLSVERQVKCREDFKEASSLSIERHIDTPK
jgi:hypothetical protein